MDNQTTLRELKDLLKKFRDDRDWKQFHDPKNLAEAISIEASELLEHFLWLNESDVKHNLESSPTYKQEITDELADIINYCIQFALVTDIDISTAVKEKLKKAEAKYPISKAKNRAGKNANKKLS